MMFTCCDATNQKRNILKPTEHDVDLVRNGIDRNILNRFFNNGNCKAFWMLFDVQLLILF